MLHRTRKSAWRRSALLIASAVLAMTMLAACGGSKEHSLEFKNVSGGDVVATYKDGQITQDELDKYLDLYVLAQPAYASVVEIPEFKEMIVEQYVAYKILSSQASEESMKEAQKQVDEQIEQYKEYKKSDETFATEVKDRKVSDEDMATFLLLNTAAVLHINSKVTDEDLAAAYESTKADYGVYTVRHILVKTTEQDTTTGETKELRTDEEALARAKEVKAKLDAGGDWAALAKDYSDDPGSKDKGGLYEDAVGGGWVESFKKAAFEQELNVVGEPFQSEHGYHVMKVEKREIKTLDQLTDEQKEQVKNTAAYTYMEKFMTDEMPKQELKVTLPEPEPTDDAATEDGAAGNAEGDAAAEEGAANEGAANGTNAAK